MPSVMFLLVSISSVCGFFSWVHSRTARCSCMAATSHLLKRVAFLLLGVGHLASCAFIPSLDFLRGLWTSVLYDGFHLNSDYAVAWYGITYAALYRCPLSTKINPKGSLPHNRFIRNFSRWSPSIFPLSFVSISL